jgi:hypothetical protein
VPTFADRGVSRGQRGGSSTVVNLRRLQRGLKSLAALRERSNKKIIEGKTQAIYFSPRIRPSDSLLTLKERNIPFANIFLN